MHHGFRIEVRPHLTVLRGPFGIPLGPHIEMIQVRTPLDELIDRLFKLKLEVKHRVTVVPGSVSLTAEPSQVRARMDVDFHLDAGFKGGPVPLTPPGSAEGRIHVEVTRSLAWTGGRMVLTGGGTSVQVRATRAFSPLNPFTPAIDPGVLLPTNAILGLFSGKLNQQVQSVLPSHVVDAGEMLKRLAKPINLGVGPQVYVNVEQVTPWVWAYGAAGLKSGLTLRCRPGTQVMRGTVKFQPAGPASGDVTSHVDLEYIFTRDELSRRFATALRQSLDPRIEVGDPRVLPAGDAAPSDGPQALGRVRIELPVRAPVRATLAVAGLLWLDGNTIGLKEIHAEATVSGAEAAPAGLSQTDSGVIDAALAQVRLDLSETFKALTSQSTEIRGDLGLLTLNVTNAGIKDVYITPDSVSRLVLRVELQARLAEPR